MPTPSHPDLPPYEPNRYFSVPAPVPAKFAARSGLGQKRRFTRLLRYGVPVLIGGLVLALIASDLIAPSNHFWRSHQMIAGLVSGAALAFVAVFGIDRVLAARGKRRWLSFALMVTSDFNRRVGVEELLYVSVDTFRLRHGIDAEIDGDYLAFLPEALEDRDTWLGGEDEETWALMDWVADEERILTESLSTWAPVLIAEPRLAEIADAAADVLTTMTFVKNTLDFGDPDRHPDDFEGTWAPDSERTEELLTGLRAHRFAEIRMEGLLARYKREAELAV
jgi:hypothetical protein